MALAAALVSRAMTHPYLAEAQKEVRVVDGDFWLRIPFARRVPLDPAVKTDFTFEGAWFPAGSIVTGSCQWARLPGVRTHTLCTQRPSVKRAGRTGMQLTW